MGNRDDLVDGAKRCLYEKGYVNTTARDIAAASGVSLAAIGYHFGSKEALMNEAVLNATEEWGEELARTLSAGGGLPAERRFAAIWDRVIESVSTHRRLWTTQYELIAVSEQSAEMRALFARGNRAARLGLAAVFQGLDPVEDEAVALAVGTLYQSLLTGVIAQWLTDPETAPSGDDLAAALQAVAGTLG
ncbi:MAG TPA: TetR/AcrR family transcriptional regulator [Actinoallomurus sp.]|jgi:AcrR family transcriptional regulator